MIVPRYWSESKTRKIVNGKQFTIKRFGWSDINELDAKSLADARLQEAVSTLMKEGDVRRIDHKTSYNGAEGIPIREEVISTHEDVVISRNSYGALCLNTPDVLFGDIDFEYEASFQIHAISFVLLLICSLLLGLSFESWAALGISIFAAAIFTSTLANALHRATLKLSGGAEKKALNTITHVSTQNSELNIRVYRTPLGYRVLFMNSTYNPTDGKAIQLLNDLKSDRTYIQMCKNQNCFRARVSPKPWRIGIVRLRPTSGVWPIKEERMEERREWVKMYEMESANVSSCHYVASIGSDKVDTKAEFVRKIHDELCKVNNSELKIA